MTAIAVGAAEGKELALDAAVEEVVGRLLADEARGAQLLGDVVGLADLPGGEGGAAGVADLALALEEVEGAEGLVDGNLGLGAVDLVEVDVVRLESL